jgi:CBS domain-containing protein
VILEAPLREVRVADVFRRDPTCVSPSATVADLIEGHLLPNNRRAMPVCEGERLVGIVTLGDVRGVNGTSRTRKRVGEIMADPDCGHLAPIAPVDGIGSCCLKGLPQPMRGRPLRADAGHSRGRQRFAKLLA